MAAPAVVHPAAGNATVGPGHPLFVIAGPDVIEAEDFAIRHAKRLKEITTKFEGGMETRPIHRVPFQVLGEATAAEIEQFEQAKRNGCGCVKIEWRY